MKAALLADRGIVKVSGDSARKFLNGLLTTDMVEVTPADARFTALLTPQGKILVDFFVVENKAVEGGGFLLDCPRVLASGLADRLNFYKLRAKITVEDLSDKLGVLALWDGEVTTPRDAGYRDPRHPALGWRLILPLDMATQAVADLGVEMVDAGLYEAHRVALGIPRGGLDFVYGDTFPHEADMDQLKGVDFDKGCFVGQEVVSRIEHRGSARSRVVPVVYDGSAPEAGTPVTSAGKSVGVMGSSASGRGLALLRLDRVADALLAGHELTAGGIRVRVVKPDWARFAWPGETAPAQ